MCHPKISKSLGIKIRVQPFSQEYQQQVLDLIVGIQQREFSIPITGEDQPDLNAIPDFYQRNRGNFWLALDGDAVVGTIALLDIGDKQAALRKMFVAKTHRGNRVGTATKLLETLLGWAGQQRIRDIWLGTTPKFLAAHRFYEKNGFMPVSKADLPESFPVMVVDTKFYRLPEKNSGDDYPV